MIAVFFGCSKTDNPVVFNSLDEASISAKPIDNENVDIVLEEFAKTLALAIADENLLDVFKQEIDKKFDGQPEFLYKKVKNKKVEANKVIKDLLKQARKGMKKNRKNISKSSVDDLTLYLDNKMNLQIFMPFYDSWDGVTPPLVGFVPQQIDEFEINEIKSFDTDGNVITIPVENAHEYCYVLVGPNERTDEYGELMTDLFVRVPGDTSFAFMPLAKNISPQTSIESVPGPGNRPDGATLKFFRLAIYKDFEAYAIMGDPEISVKFKTISGYEITDDYDHRFDGYWKWGIHHDCNSNWRYFSTTVLTHWWKDVYGPYIGFLVYERDQTWFDDITVKIGLFKWNGAETSISFKIKQFDDPLYSGIIDWADDDQPTIYSNSNCKLAIAYAQ